MKKFHIQSVGCGYFDCICPMENAVEFIDTMTKAGIRITDLTWWCHVTNGHEPCGMGGPQNKFGTGWYSEICMDDTIAFSSNDEVKDFLTNTWLKSDSYQPCFTPAFRLAIPDNREHS